MTRTNGSAGMPDYTREALRDLGTRGVSITGHAYAWCERGQHFHIANERDVEDVRGTIGRVTLGAITRNKQARKGMVRLQWNMRTRQPKRDVRVTQNGAEAFIDQFNAQRTRPHMTRHETRAMTLASIGA